jgi:hypothetical protein
MQNSSVEIEFRQHLITKHMMFARPSLIEKRLRKLMSKARYEKYLETDDEYRAGSTSIEAIYQQMETLEEANVLMSHQAEATLKVGAALYDASRRCPFAAMQVCDLGCYTGGFTSWFAERHPDSRIVGVDRQEHLLALASKATDLGNLTYRFWDYTYPPTASGEFDLLFSCFGIDIEGLRRSLHHSLDPYNRRSGEAYQEVRRRVEAVLVNWRAAAKTDARLFASLRIGDYDNCLAVVDAAAAAGWKFSFNGSTKIIAEGEVFPILIFSASQFEGDANDNDLLRWWTGANARRDDVLQDRNESMKYLGGEALLRYRELRDKRIRRHQSRTYGDMHTMRLECGTAGDRFYRFKIATNRYLELEFLTTEDLSGL